MIEQKNEHEKYALVLSVTGTNKEYQCMRCNWSAKGLGKLVNHLQL